MSKVPVTYEYLCNLATHARRVGTLDVFADVALQWAGLAEKEIGRLRADRDLLLRQLQEWRKENGPSGWIDSLRVENKRLRAALAATLPVVQNERVRLAYNCEHAGAPSVIEGYRFLIATLDAVIAQADAAMGREG